MAAGALTFFIPLTATNLHQKTTLVATNAALSLYKPNVISLFSPLSRRNFFPFSPSRAAYRYLPNFPESGALAVPTETELTSEPQPKSMDVQPIPIVQADGTSSQIREEIFAVVVIGSRQYIVHPGRWLVTQRLKGANVNDKIVLNRVLLVGTKTCAYLGRPILANTFAHAVVEEQGLDPKIIVFKYKRKKNYRRTLGHQQPNTRIRITGITGYESTPPIRLDSPPPIPQCVLGRELRSFW